MNKLKEEQLIDLHTHTCYSDGELTPNELLKEAIKNNVGTIAITDHNTISGVKNIDYTQEETKKIKVIHGIELSAGVEKGRMHILGYNIDINNKDLNKKIKELKDNKINTILSTIEQIKKDYNIIFGYDDIKELINSKHNLGRPDIARLCVKKGYVSTVQEAFDKYLNNAYNKIKAYKKELSYDECIKLILNSGGIPVLAHPRTLKLNEKELLITIKKMIQSGLKGIEVYHSSHSTDEMNQYLKIANECNLLISGGSDYHGPFVKPDIELGTGKDNNLKIKKLSILDEIKKL